MSTEVGASAPKLLSVCILHRHGARGPGGNWFFATLIVFEKYAEEGFLLHDGTKVLPLFIN